MGVGEGVGKGRKARSVEILSPIGVLYSLQMTPIVLCSVARPEGEMVAVHRALIDPEIMAEMPRHR